VSRTVVPFFVLLLAVLPAHADGADRVPILVELFTSEGCSSCPPADALLARLLTEQPIDGVEVIALAQHVDYWNDLGWTDPFTSPGATERQRDYVRAFGLPSAYTPQLVIAGRRDVVGGNEPVALGAIRAAARFDARAHLSLRAVAPTDRAAASVRFEIESRDLAAAKEEGPADLLVALVENGLASKVRAGENVGHALHHDAVVRRLEIVGELPAGRPVLRITTPDLALDRHWRRTHLAAVAFVQARESRHVLAVARTPLP
jgi:hypothetical protein